MSRTIRSIGVSPIWLEMRSYGESQTDIHPAGVPLHRRVEKSLNLSKGDDLIEFLTDLALRHSENGAIQIDVFPPRQLWVKSGSNFQEARYTAS